MQKYGESVSSYLTQQEADALRVMHKYYMGIGVFNFPDMGGKLAIPLHSHDKKEEFLLDISRGRLAIYKHTLQNRTRKTIVLVRLDIGGSPHCNPDGAVIPCPHVHVYKEGFGCKWAYPLPDIFSKPEDIWATLNTFMKFCHIVKEPTIRRGLLT